MVERHMLFKKFMWHEINKWYLLVILQVWWSIGTWVTSLCYSGEADVCDGLGTGLGLYKVLSARGLLSGIQTCY